MAKIPTVFTEVDRASLADVAVTQHRTPTNPWTPGTAAHAAWDLLTPGTAAYSAWKRQRDGKPRPENADDWIAPALNEERPEEKPLAGDAMMQLLREVYRDGILPQVLRQKVYQAITSGV